MFSLWFLPFELQSRWIAAALVLALALTACSSRTAEEIADDRAQVLGTWEYQTDGIRSLQRGTLQITERDGKLVGQIQDSWRGRIEARVDVRGPYMALDFDRLRITGQLERGRFAGSVRNELWDVSHSRTHGGSDGYFVARRVHSKSTMDEVTDFGCASLLHESSYACSALGSP